MARWDEDLFFASAVELNRRLREKEFPALELMRAFTARMEQMGPRYRALVLSLREDALRRAQAVDKELKRGRTRGPLQGVPFAVSDLMSVAGRPTAWGSALFAGQVFDDDAAAVSRLLGAKANIIAKLSTVELGGAGGGPDSAAGSSGLTVNPWDRSRWSGGAASGAAAAVAAALVPFALAMEACGSLILPSAFCGVTALRPTYGLVSLYGAMTGSWSMAKIGIAARTVEDCGHVLDEISGGDDRDPACSGKRFRFTPQYSRPIEGIRIGYVRDDFERLPSEEMRAPLQAALALLRQGGAQMAEITWPDLPLADIAQVIMAAEASSFFADEINAGRLQAMADRRQAAGLLEGAGLKAAEYLQAMRLRRMVQDSIAKTYADVDILVSPASFHLPPLLSEIERKIQRSSTLITFKDLPPMLLAGNLAGLPALTVPCGKSGALPVGILLTGKPLGENWLLKAGGLIEAKRQVPWRPAW